MITTGSDIAVSAAEKSAPRSIGIPIAVKYPGVVTLYSTTGARSCCWNGGRPAIVKPPFMPKLASGIMLMAPAAVTPGMRRMSSSARRVHLRQASRVGVFFAGEQELKRHQPVDCETRVLRL